MAYLPGGTWRDGAREFPLRDRVRVLERIARALAYAHSRGVLHEDVKPSNILLDLDGTPFLSDFGLAHEFPLRPGREGFAGGTLDYMAPERLPAGEAGSDPAADIFSLGVVLHESVTGRRPYEGRTPEDLRRAILAGRVPDSHPWAPEADRDLAAICFKALAPDPRARYAGAEDMADDLSRWLSGAEVEARPRGIPERILRWLALR
jgi:serine/threonine protein kinase